MRPATADRPPRMLLVSVSLISASALAYEVLLMRLFSIIQWHHFAYMIISVALLGYGASGTFLTLFQNRLLPHFHFAFVTAAGAFAMTAVLGFAIAQRIPFNPLELVWDGRQSLYLAGVYLLLLVPFLLAASAVGLALSRFHAHIGRIYSFDLAGAGAGAFSVVALLLVLSPGGCLKALSAAAFAGALLASAALLEKRHHRIAVALISGALVLLLLAPASWTRPRISEYKGLSLALQTAGARVVHEESGPLGLLTVLENDQIPFRHAPGLSLNCTQEPPAQLALFTDGDSMSALNAFDGRMETLDYLDFTTSALPYHLLKRPRVLVLGAGGGADVLQAIAHDAASVDAVELNPQTVHLVRDVYQDFIGNLFHRPDVRIRIAEARGFIASTPDHYDLIQVALLDSFGASSAGVYALSENYLYTVEALQAMIGRLEPGGILALTRWVQIPPRDSLKLFATAIRALEASSVGEPGSRLAMIRSWRTVTILVKNGAWTGDDLDRLRNFCREHSFDAAYYPGMTRSEANRFNRLDEPWFFDGAAALLSPKSGDFLRRYKFNLEPATDDRPFFFNFFRWRTLPEFLSMRARGGMPLIEWGYIVLLATFVQAVLLGFAFILLPLAVLRRKGLVKGGGRIGGYFLLLGAAFLFIEIAFIQKFILFLSHPVYATSVVLCAFLVFAGIGSRCAVRFTIRAAVVAIAAIAILYLFTLPLLFQRGVGWPDAAKIVFSLLLIAPLAFFMGMPFPLGLQRVAGAQPRLIPWAWAVNGFSSVSSAVLAALLAFHLGFNAVILLAVAAYGLAALLRPR